MSYFVWMGRKTLTQSLINQLEPYWAY